MSQKPFTKKIEAKPHTPIYTMHRYFARRPHNVFSELVKHYSKPNDIILDPFCGGGVTVVESLALGRKAIGVDVNPLAAYVTTMQAKPLEISSFLKSFEKIAVNLQKKMASLYTTTCPVCRKQSEINWVEWQDDKILRINYLCSSGHNGEKKPTPADIRRSKKIRSTFARVVKQQRLWYPKNKIPDGDKTNTILKKGYEYFWQLFTERNLLAMAYLYKEISKVKDTAIREFLYFAFSASLKWTSKQCHLRGDVVEGWALHAYWVYPKQLEINVWKTFTKRVQAILRGKEYLAQKNFHAVIAKRFDNLNKSENCFILSQSADTLPLPNNSVDCVITDPPYGDNVNYAELSDFWTIWHPHIRRTIDKRKEAVINKTLSKDVHKYEELLASVFRECHRVVKPNGVLVATFNSKDLEIVSVFLKAVVSGGFELVKNGLHYQEPIKAYTTTVHAKEVGAFTGDFIFTFRKSKRLVEEAPSQIDSYLKRIETTISRQVQRSRTEIEFRRAVYERLIPQFANWVYTSNGQINSIARHAEQLISKQEFKLLPFEKARAIAR